MWLWYRCSGEGAHELLSIQQNRLKYKNATHTYCCMWVCTVHIFTYIYTKSLRKKSKVCENCMEKGEPTTCKWQLLWTNRTWEGCADTDVWLTTACVDDSVIYLRRFYVQYDRPDGYVTWIWLDSSFVSFPCIVTMHYFLVQHHKRCLKTAGFFLCCCSFRYKRKNFFIQKKEINVHLRCPMW